ncbi:MAG TPA: prepilin-type N-terminal cleavage/methylation domain-containing protein [Candidatus Cybelea sp.]|nr:prepilin-type N-terminal cleavage/methylation domain-containing protein [Candidatus Cybelea sp.]
MNRDRTTCYGRAGAPEQGVTLIEVTVAVVILMIVASMAIVQMQPTLQRYRSNAAANQVQSVLREARELAISERRTIVVQFVNKNTLELFQITEPANTISAAPFLTVPIENTVEFMTFGGEVDTPDNFSGALSVPNGIYFDGVTGGPNSGMEFQTDGEFTDGNGNPINGTVFVGVPNVPSSARAVTVLGNTGRIHTWYGGPNFWFDQ